MPVVNDISGSFSAPKYIARARSRSCRRPCGTPGRRPLCLFSCAPLFGIPIRRAEMLTPCIEERGGTATSNGMRDIRCKQLVRTSQYSCTSPLSQTLAELLAERNPKSPRRLYDGRLAGENCLGHGFSSGCEPLDSHRHPDTLTSKFPRTAWPSPRNPGSL